MILFEGKVRSIIRLYGMMTNTMPTCMEHNSLNIIKCKFPFPKSHAVMECIKAVVHDKNDSIILDYFAGSGTTGQAVLELNKTDGEHRTYILSQIMKIILGKEQKSHDRRHPRLKNVMKGYKGSLRWQTL